MIPLNKNSLSRIDLSTVLENMVENNINGNQLGQEFAHKIATMLGGVAGISICNVPDSFSCIVDLLNKNSVISKEVNTDSTLMVNTTISPKALLLLPITIPHVLAASLQRMNFALFFYDVAEDAMSPNIKEEVIENLLEQYSEIPRCLVLFYPFGINNTFPLMVSCIFENVSKIVISYTVLFTKNDTTISQKENNFDSTVSPNGNESDTTSHYFYASSSDFSVLIMGKNNVITSATGAVMSVNNKKYKRGIKALESKYYLLSDFNAALAHSQLKQLEKFNQKCSAIKQYYKAAAYKNSLSLPEIVMDEDTIISSFPIILKGESKSSIQFFQKQGIECALFFENSYLYYSITQMPHRKEAYIANYPNAIELLHRIIHVPLYASLTNDEMGHISKVIASLL